MTVAEDLYPSRIEAEPYVSERVEPVVHGPKDEIGGVDRDRIEQYERDGFLFVPSLFTSEEVDVFRRELYRLSNDPEVRNAEEAFCEPDSGALRSLFRVQGFSALFDALARDQRILSFVRAVLNDDVYLHQSRINLKPGFRGREFYWHSDFETWHVEDGLPGMRAMSVSVALTENNEFNGALMLIPGSHRKFVACVGGTPDEHYRKSLRKQEYGVPDDDTLRRLVEEGGLAAPKGPAGSVVFFDCNTMHGSGSNISPYPRSNAFFVYNAVSNRAVSPFGAVKPRPEFVAARGRTPVLASARPDYKRMLRN